MAKGTSLDYMDWIINLLRDQRKGSGFVATDIARRLPWPKCAVGIVHDNGLLTFYASRSSLTADEAGACFYEAALTRDSGIAMMEVKEALVLSVPLPDSPANRNTLFLAAPKNEKGHMMDNRADMEELVRRMSAPAVEEPQLSADGEEGSIDSDKQEGNSNNS